MADLPIFINIEEDTERFTPMTSRIAHLMVIDMLAVIVARQRGPELIQHLNSIKQSIRSLYRQPDNDQIYRYAFSFLCDMRVLWHTLHTNNKKNHNWNSVTKYKEAPSWERTLKFQMKKLSLLTKTVT